MQHSECCNNNRTFKTTVCAMGHMITFSNWVNSKSYSTIHRNENQQSKQEAAMYISFHVYNSLKQFILVNEGSYCGHAPSLASVTSVLTCCSGVNVDSIIPVKWLSGYGYVILWGKSGPTNGMHTQTQLNLPYLHTHTHTVSDPGSRCSDSEGFLTGPLETLALHSRARRRGLF